MLDFLSNPSVAAFIGAFSAFMLVAATDLRRRYRNRSLLRHLVSDNKELALRKLEAVRTSKALLREGNRVAPSPIMRFPLAAIRDYQLQVLNLLSSSHKPALNGMLYWMEEVDGLLSEATQAAYALSRSIKAEEPNEKLSALKDEYCRLPEEAEINLKYLSQFLSWYAEDKPKKILEFKHPTGGR